MKTTSDIRIFMRIINVWRWVFEKRMLVCHIVLSVSKSLLKFNVNKGCYLPCAGFIRHESLRHDLFHIWKIKTEMNINTYNYFIWFIAIFNTLSLSLSIYLSIYPFIYLSIYLKISCYIKADLHKLLTTITAFPRLLLNISNLSNVSIYLYLSCFENISVWMLRKPYIILKFVWLYLNIWMDSKIMRKMKGLWIDTILETFNMTHISFLLFTHGNVFECVWPVLLILRKCTERVLILTEKKNHFV